MMKSYIIISILLFFTILVSINDENTVKIQMLIFFSDNCPECDSFLSFTLPDLEANYNLEYTLYNEFEENASILLKEIEKQFGLIESYPVILIGNQLLNGHQVNEDLLTLVEQYTHSGGCCVPLRYDMPEDIHDNDKFPVYISYLYRQDTEEYDYIDDIFTKIEYEFPLVKIRKFTLESESGIKLYSEFSKIIQSVEDDNLLIPKVYIGNDVLPGSKIDYYSVRKLILKYQEYFNISPWSIIDN